MSTLPDDFAPAPPGSPMAVKDGVKLALSILYFLAGLWQFLGTFDYFIGGLRGSWLPGSLHTWVPLYNEGWAPLSGSLLMLVAWWLFPFGKSTGVAHPEKLRPLVTTIGIIEVVILTLGSVFLGNIAVLMAIEFPSEARLDAGFLLVFVAAWWLFPFGKTEDKPRDNPES